MYKFECNSNIKRSWRCLTFVIHSKLLTAVSFKMERYDFNAPQFYDFTNNDGSDAEVEAYFELEHEDSNGLIIQTEQVSCDNGYQSEDHYGDAEDPLQLTFQRSYSTSDLSTSHINDTHNSCSKENINKYDKPGSVPETSTLIRNTRRRSNSVQCLFERPSNKYVSLAEAVKQFHRKTPDRFHSKSAKTRAIFIKEQNRHVLTVAMSPCLATKRRARPTTMLSHEEREFKEMQELQQKFKIKANPVNKKVLLGPMKAPCVVKKPVTEPKPFNITQVSEKKAPTPMKPIPQFRAQPLPKFIKESPKIVPKTPLKPSKPLKPEVVVQFQKPLPLKPTVLEPFTFLERDKDSHQKKQQIFLQLAEEEKKSREFHAKKLPSFYSSAERLSSTLLHSSSSSIKYSNEELNVKPGFKAKPARVLEKEPFIPKLEKRLVEIAEFQLHSEDRARRRDAFQEKLKKREEMIANFRKLEELEKARQEMEEVAKFRVQTEHKAQPIRKYKKVAVITSKPLTVPVSPTFLHRNKDTDKENVSP